MLPFLVDENLSRKLLTHLLPIFPKSKHIIEVHLERTDDFQIWKFARENDFCILTKDWDFQIMSVLQGCPPKVVRMNCGNVKTSEIIQIITSKFITIQDFQENDNDCYLEIA